MKTGFTLEEPGKLGWEVFIALKQAKILTEWPRKEYNLFPPHSAKRYRPPAPEARKQ